MNQNSSNILANLQSGPKMFRVSHVSPELFDVLETRRTSGIAVYEAGFSDRPLVVELTASLNIVAAQRRDVVQAIREHREQVTAILQKYPAYFAHIFNDVL